MMFIQFQLPDVLDLVGMTWYVSSNSQDSQWQKHEINTPPPPSETHWIERQPTTKPSTPMSRPVSAAGRTSSSPATWTSGVWRRYEKPTARWNPGMCWWPSMVDLQRTPKPGCKFPGGPIGPWEKMKQDETSWISWHGKNGIYLDNLDLSRGKWKFVLYIVLLIRSCLM